MKLCTTHTTLAMTIALSASIEVAAEAPSETKLEHSLVTGQFLSLDKLNSVKTPTPVLDVPQSLSIVSAEQIQKQAFESVGDVLRYTPGLSISQGEGHRDAMIIRGIQTTADFFVDGMRDDVQYYRPLYNVEQVEVLRGSNALLFGRGGGGGVINRVIKKAKTGEQFSEIRASADTFGGYSITGDGNYSTSDHIAFRLNGTYQEHENHRDAYNGSTTAINPSLSLDLSPTTKVVLSYEHLDDERVVDRGVPSVQTDGSVNVPLSGYRDTFFGSPSENYTSNEAKILRARLDHNFSANLRGNMSMHYANFDKYYQNLYASDAVTLSEGRVSEVEFDGYSDATERENLITQLNLVGEFKTAGIGHTLLMGLEFGTQDTANARFDNLFTENGQDQLRVPFSQPWAIPEFAFSTPVRDRQSELSFASIYIQDQLDLSSTIKLVLGLRYDEFDIDVVDNTEANDGDDIDGNFGRKDAELTPRLGLIYKPAKNISMYASYSETFLPRSGEQFLTLDLDTQSTRPQFFENREAGIKWDLHPELSFTTSLFELDRESYTSVDPEDPSRLILVEGSKTAGIEFQLLGSLSKYWSVSTGYSYLDGEVERADGSGNDGNKTRQTPEHMFSIWNNIDINNDVSLGFGASYQDSFYIAEDNAVEVPSYTRIDAAVYYRLSTSTRVQFNIENLFDTEYFPDAHSNNNISTGSPLNARFSITKEL